MEVLPCKAVLGIRFPLYRTTYIGEHLHFRYLSILMILRTKGIVHRKRMGPNSARENLPGNTVGIRIESLYCFTAWDLNTHPFSHNHGSGNLGSSNIAFVSFRVVFHFHDFGRNGNFHGIHYEL